MKIITCTDWGGVQTDISGLMTSEFAAVHMVEIATVATETDSFTTLFAIFPRREFMCVYLNVLQRGWDLSF